MTGSTILAPLGVLAPLNEIVAHLQDCNPQFQYNYQEFNPESLDTSLDIRTAIQKVSTPVLISRLQS